MTTPTGPEVLDVLRVFCGPDGRYGNALGVVRDGTAVRGEAARQELARRLGFSETVFVDDDERGIVDIYTPTLRLPFAGHPCVGTAWLLDLPELVTPAGVVTARQDGEFSWITARPEWAPPRTLRQYASPLEVDSLAVPAPGEWIYAWAWQDEAAGRVRARGCLSDLRGPTTFPQPPAGGTPRHALSPHARITQVRPVRGRSGRTPRARTRRRGLIHEDRRDTPWGFPAGTTASRRTRRRARRRSSSRPAWAAP